MPSVDNLNIVISASAKEANASLNELMKTLKNLKGQLNISASNGIKITNSLNKKGGFPPPFNYLKYKNRNGEF